MLKPEYRSQGRCSYGYRLVGSGITEQISYLDVIPM